MVFVKFHNMKPEKFFFPNVAFKLKQKIFTLQQVETILQS